MPPMAKAVQPATPIQSQRLSQAEPLLQGQPILQTQANLQTPPIPQTPPDLQTQPSLQTQPIPPSQPIQILAAHIPAASTVLTPPALAFVAELEKRFGARRRELLQQRTLRQARLDAGETPVFLPETQALRSADWKVRPPPAGLVDRRVEITGPVDRKMMINALNSGANVFMADFEDSLSPKWQALVEGQLNLIDAVAGTLAYDAPGGKSYRMGVATATLMVRPRGWHLEEPHAQVEGAAMSATLFDAGLFLFHCAATLDKEGKGPYLYLPKMESHLEARLWNDVLSFSEERLGLAPATVRVTVLVETIFAAFQMDEILHELAQRACGLNAGRWDYLFSIVKAFRGRSDVVLPDRARLTMEAPFMEAYAKLLVSTCHRRGVHAMGGMSAFVPNRSDSDVNRLAFEKVRLDKTREAGLGFDGTWVAHPDLVEPARTAFRDVIGEKANQLDRFGAGPGVDGAQLLDFHMADAQITKEGLRDNLAVALAYIAAWLRGTGAMVRSNLMEDTATAEIARAQVWQWVRQNVPLASGNAVTADMVRVILDEEMDVLTGSLAPAEAQAGRFSDARDLLLDLVVAREFAPFLTVAGAAQLDAVAAA